MRLFSASFFRFEEKSQTIDALDTQLRKLHASTEAMYELRVSLSSQTGYLAKSLSTLAMCEENTELAGMTISGCIFVSCRHIYEIKPQLLHDFSGALSQLSNVQEKVEHIHGEQARADFFLLAELIKDYIGLVAAVKDVFQVR